MNFQVVWSAIQPFLTQLLASPQFQALLQKILADLLAKINSGVHPDTAVQQATGQIGVAALLHLTGNPVADIQSLIASLQPHATTPTTSVTGVATPGIFTS
jgi:hypothetical protein